MKVYAVSKNSGPTQYGRDPVTLVYLGTSIKEADDSVGHFVKYQTDKIPAQFLESYTALPRGMEFEMLTFFMADGWWYSIVMFDLEEP